MSAANMSSAGSGPLSVIVDALASAFFAWGDPENLLTYDEWVAEHRSVLIDALRLCDNHDELHVETAIRKLLSSGSGDAA